MAENLEVFHSLVETARGLARLHFRKVTRALLQRSEAARRGAAPAASTGSNCLLHQQGSVMLERK